MAEKTVMELPRELRALVTKGKEAATRDNFDYAVTLFSQVLRREPSCVDVRKALRNSQLSRAGGRTGFFKKMFAGAATSPQLAKAQLALRNQNLTEAMDLAEQVLDADPYNSHAHKVIADAAELLEMPQTLLLSLEHLAKGAPKDKTTVIRYANALADAHDNARAEKLLADLAAHLPADAEVSKALKNLSARRTMHEGGYEKLADGSGSYRDILRDESEARELEQASRVVTSEDRRTQLIQEYEARLPTEPDNARIRRSLADLYVETHRFDEAQKLYEALLENAPSSDPSLIRALTNLKVRRLDHQIAQLDAAAPDFEERSQTMEAEKRAVELEEAKKRVEKAPTDLALRFELGTLCLQSGKISEAIQEFQRAQNNPHKRIAAMNGLAQCFAQRKMFDLAERTLQNAIKEKPAMDEEKKELIYNLGDVLERMGKREESIEQFKLIYEIDIGYRDVAARVDAYYAAQ